jgi:hypothetical protein
VKTLALIALCGCDSIFGISQIMTPATTDASPDGVPTRTVQCDFLWHVVSNDLNGNPMVTVLAAPPAFATFTANGMPLVLGGDGSFHFDAPVGAPYTLELATPSGPTFFIRDSNTCHLDQPFFHRLDGALPTKPTVITANLTSPAPTTGLLYFGSMGLRSLNPPKAVAANPYQLQLDWQLALLLSQEPAPLLDAAAGDRFYVEHFAYDMTQAFYVIDQAAMAAVTLTDGVPSSIAGLTLVAPPPRCTAIHTVNGMLGPQLTAATPHTGMLTGGWGVYTTALPSEGVGELQPLAFSTSGIASDENITLHYGDPYPGETEMLLDNVVLTSSITSGAAAPAPLQASLTSYTPVTADTSGACAASVTAPTAIALVNGFTVGGAPLTADHQMVSIDRTAPVPIALATTAGPYDELIASLYEVTAVNGMTKLVFIANYFPLGLAFGIDPSRLLVGHEYLLAATARVGLPLSVTQFDRRVYAYPFLQSAIPSTIFKIAN